jgi:hypothetical protein
VLGSILSVLAGFVCWTVLWLGTHAVISAAIPGVFADDGSVHRSDVLGIILALSVIFSIVAGYLTGWVAQRKPVPHTVVLGVIQLIVGIFVQVQVWDKMPLWYHLPFLALLLPGNMIGGVLRAHATQTR